MKVNLEKIKVMVSGSKDKIRAKSIPVSSAATG